MTGKHWLHWLLERIEFLFPKPKIKLSKDVKPKGDD